MGHGFTWETQDKAKDTVEYQSLITPMEHWTHWDTDAEKIHTITPAALKAFGNKGQAVAHKLNELLQEQTVYCDSKEWEGFWCNVLFSGHNVPQSFKIEDIKALLQTDAQWAEYANKKQQLMGSGKFELHNALDDARLIYGGLEGVVAA